MVKNIYIHIGMHKTATTFLQDNLFPKLENSEFIRGDSKIGEILDDINYSHPIAVDIEQKREEIEIEISEIEKENILISREGLVGNMANSYLEFDKNMDFIYKLFPDAKIILTFRRQDSWLESAFKQTLHEGWTITFKEFTDTNIKRPLAPSFDYKILNYLYFYNKIDDKFKDTLFVPFEMFVKDRESFVQNIGNFLEEEIELKDVKDRGKGRNRGYSLISARIAYVLNRFLGYHQHSLGFISINPIKRFFSERYNRNIFYKTLARFFYRISLRIFLQRVLDKIIYIKYSPMKDSFRKEILSFHKNSNRKLEEKIGIDLKKYGYYA
jgi:hypothetical protein